MPTLDATGSASPTVGEILTKLRVDPETGLNPADVQERLTNYGPNALAEEKIVLPILKGKFGVPAVLGMVAAVSVLGLVVTLAFGREDMED